MSIQLNIKDQHTVELARDLARQLGKSVTETVREALEEKARARAAERDAYMARVTAFADRVYAQLPDDVKRMSSKEIMDSIYDDDQPDGFAR